MEEKKINGFDDSNIEKQIDELFNKDQEKKKNFKKNIEVPKFLNVENEKSTKE